MTGHWRFAFVTSLFVLRVSDKGHGDSFTNELEHLYVCTCVDTSLKDGLFHEYKKHGKVTMVKVVGQATDRFAVVCFKKPDDVEKALEVSKVSGSRYSAIH